MALLAQFESENRRTPGEAEDLSELPNLAEAEGLLLELASVFSGSTGVPAPDPERSGPAPDPNDSNIEARYRALLEQIPAVVFMAYMDRGVSEAYVSPEIEAALGYSREDWLRA